MQHARGFIVGCANGWLISWEAEHPEQQIGRTLYAACYIRVTRWLVTCLQSSPIGTNGAGFCSNLGARGLFSSLAGFLLGAHWLAGSRSPDGGGESHHFTGNRNPSPGPLLVLAPLPAPAPAAPHNKTFFLSFKNQQEKYQTHEL